MKKATCLSNPKVRLRQTLVRIATGRDQKVTRCCEEGDMVVRSGSQIATERTSPSEGDKGIGLARFGLGLTHLWSTSREQFVQVSADEKGKKKSFLWSFHSSSATKSSSTRP
ncbi:hypothetical protein Taro_045751 [Colocasia esculenta]|uniref:Uncharacterized protein n=1 Tax=Colocasia esculenta TaxID=4460 RepID=A0A843WQB6_COLES|nr:hypothetical protein [Colocasia esculenta]